MRTEHAPFSGIILLLALAMPASAHDTWSDGGQVDPQTKELCCSGADTKIADDLVHSAMDGVTFSDRPGELVRFSRIQVSPDGHWWRSVWGGQIRCVFGPYAY